MATVLEEILIHSSRLTQAELERARERVAARGGTLDQALAALDLVQPEEMASLMTERLGVPCLGGANKPRFDPSLREIFPASVARKLRVVPIERAARLLVAAAEDPRKQHIQEELERLTGLEIQVLAVLPSVLLQGMKAIYGDHDGAGAAAGASLPDPVRGLTRDVLSLVTPEVARRFRAIPLGLEAGKLQIAVSDPDNMRTVRAMRFATERDVVAVAVPEDVLELALDQYYGSAEAKPKAMPPPVLEPEPSLASAASPAAATQQAATAEALFEDAMLFETVPTTDDPADGLEMVGIGGATTPDLEPDELAPAVLETQEDEITAPGAVPPPRQHDLKDAPVERIDASRLRDIDPQLISLLTADAVRNYTALPVALEGNTLVVAMADPGNGKAVRALQYATGLLVRAAAADGDSLKAAIVRYYRPRVGTASDVEAETIDPDVLDEVPDDVRLVLKPEIARRYNAVPIERTGRSIVVAMVDPSDLAALQDLEFITGIRVEARKIEEELLEPYLETFYVPEAEEDETARSQVAEILEDADHEVLDSVEVVDKEGQEIISLSEEAAEEAPAVRIVNMLIKEALARGGSDVHLESYENRFRARVRVDGILYEVGNPPRHLREAIISRVKVLAKLNISEQRMPQDGRLKMRFKTPEGRIKDIDMRVSTIPTIWGEKVVMRLLDPDRLFMDLTRLGLEQEPLNRFHTALRKPYGMILVVGPSGCGKTNTLYSAMSVMNSPDTNIMTAEDPVEFNIKGINQVQVLEAVGLNFASCLRSFLRQDPNIILVGEIRDYETAEIAVKASLTGHLVLSTLHTNDAAGTISRMINMGVEPFLVSTAVLLIVAQRLVRCVCSKCVQDDVRPVEELIDFGYTEAGAKDLQPKKGAGCQHCNGTGYKGRTGLFEVLEMSDAIRDIIMAGGTTLEVRRKAREEGMPVLRESGLVKVREGITSLAEIDRETVL